ncbi:MAG: flavin reductase [Clostridiales bacterium]|nr:flavin reductase [Clostridiales bacterium]
MDNNVMFKISYGLYVLTAKDDGKLNGCIVNTLQQVTTSPNRISITVNKDNFTHDMIVASGEFNVSILSEKVKFNTFKHFGFQSGRDVDKFADFPMEKSENDLPYITHGSNGFISGKVISKTDLGTHTMFIADVVDGKVFAEDNSVTYDYYHKNIKEAPNSKSKGWVCKICGYVYEGDDLPPDFICPLCKHGAADFEKL